MVTPHPHDIRAKAIRIFTFLGGIYFFLYFVLPDSILAQNGIKAHHEEISNGFILIGAMALGLGLFNIVRAHGVRCVFKRPGWFNSLALLLGLVAMITATTAQWIESLNNSADVRTVQVLGEFSTRIVTDLESPATERDIPPLAERIAALVRSGTERFSAIEGVVAATQASPTSDALKVLLGEAQERLLVARRDLNEFAQRDWVQGDAESQALLKRFSQDTARLSSAYSLLKQAKNSDTLTQRVYDFLYDGLFNQLGSAMFALLGVYIAAAAYRAFRVRTFESALMMVAAVIVMLGQISFGKEIYEEMPAIRQWLLEVPNSAAFRAIRLGAGVAGLMLAIRMWLSIESSSFSRERK